MQWSSVGTVRNVQPVCVVPASPYNVRVERVKNRHLSTSQEQTAKYAEACREKWQRKEMCANVFYKRVKTVAQHVRAEVRGKEW